MKVSKLIVFYVLMVVSLSVSSKEWSYEEIRAVGKRMLTMAGFYITCGEKGLEEVDKKAARWSTLWGSRHLIIAGIEEDEQWDWIEKGSKGIMIDDPRKSEKTVRLEFSKKSCADVKKFVESQYEDEIRHISGDYKK